MENNMTYKEWDKKIEYNSQDMGDLGNFIRVEYAKIILHDALKAQLEWLLEQMPKMGDNKYPDFDGGSYDDASVCIKVLEQALEEDK